MICSGSKNAGRSNRIGNGGADTPCAAGCAACGEGSVENDGVSSSESVKKRARASLRHERCKSHATVASRVAGIIIHNTREEKTLFLSDFSRHAKHESVRRQIGRTGWPTPHSTPRTRCARCPVPATGPPPPRTNRCVHRTINLRLRLTSRSSISRMASSLRFIEIATIASPAWRCRMRMLRMSTPASFSRRMTLASAPAGLSR